MLNRTGKARGLVDHPLRKGRRAEGYTHEEIGECLLLLGRQTEAMPHFALAYQRLSAPGVVDAERLARIRRLAGLLQPISAKRIQQRGFAGVAASIALVSAVTFAMAESSTIMPM